MRESTTFEQQRKTNADRLFDATPSLFIFVLLVSFIPARWVLPGLGAAGRPAELFAAGLFGLWLVLQLVPSIQTRRTPYRWVVFAYAATLVISYAIAQGRGLTTAESLSADRALISLAAFLGVVLMASEGIASVDDLQRLTKRIALVAGVVAAIGLVQFFLRFDPYARIRFPGLVLNAEIDGQFDVRGAGRLVRIRSSTLHPVEFSVTMAIALPLAIHHALHEPNRVIRNRRYLLAALIAGTSMLTVSRSAVVAVACGLLVLVWGWSPRQRLAAASAAMLFVVGLRILVPGLVGTLRSLFVNAGTDPSVSARTSDYDQIAPFIAERPWFGRGTGTFIPEQYILLDNTYLGTLVSVGFVGLFAFLALLFGAFVMGRHCVRRNPNNGVRHLALALMATVLTGIVVGGTFDFIYFPTASGMYFVALGASAFLGTHHQIDMVNRQPLPPAVLRPSYQAQANYLPWWLRFDPELRIARVATADTESATTETATTESGLKEAATRNA